jgi:hypothetical protein
MKRYVLAFFLLCVISPLALAQSTPTCVQGVPGAPPTATLTFTPPTANTDGSALSLPLTYNLYQSTTSGSEVLVTSALKGSPIAVTTGVTPRTTYYWKISVTDAGGNVSVLSNEVCKTFPASVPGAVTITIS